MSVAGPSRSVHLFRHLLPLNPLGTVSTPLRRPVSYPSVSSVSAGRSSLSTSTHRLISRRGAYTLAHPLPDSSTGFEGIPAAAYAGNVDTAIRDKGKGKEVDRHAAPPPPPPVSAGVEKKRVIKAKKSAITMTPAAIERLRALLSNPTPQLLRIGVKTRGCAGMAYHLDYVSPPGGKFDEVVEQDGVKVLIDSKALFSIIGSKMDWRDNRLSAGFVFDNPNIEDTCGCGESFNIRV